MSAESALRRLISPRSTPSLNIAKPAQKVKSLTTRRRTGTVSPLRAAGAR